MNNFVEKDKDSGFFTTRVDYKLKRTGPNPARGFCNAGSRRRGRVRQPAAGGP
jgi:hypothetical protein